MTDDEIIAQVIATGRKCYSVVCLQQEVISLQTKEWEILKYLLLNSVEIDYKGVLDRWDFATKDRVDATFITLTGLGLLDYIGKNAYGKKGRQPAKYALSEKGERALSALNDLKAFRDTDSKGYIKYCAKFGFGYLVPYRRNKRTGQSVRELAAFRKERALQDNDGRSIYAKRKAREALVQEVGELQSKVLINDPEENDDGHHVDPSNAVPPRRIKMRSGGEMISHLNINRSPNEIQKAFSRPDVSKIPNSVFDLARTS